MNENKYFSHDSNARNSDKILPLRMRHGAEGYGIYFMILERLREEPEYMSVKDYNMIAFDLRVDAGKVKSVVEDFGLFVFTENGKYFYSESFKRRMQRMDAKSEKLSEAGKRGNEIRWSKQRDFIATQSPPDRICDEKASQTKQNKTNKNKTNNIPPLSPIGDISPGESAPENSDTDIIGFKNQNPKKEKSSAKKEKELNYSFEEFWELYDKKVGKKDILIKKWLKLSDIERELAMSYIPKYKLSQPDKKYRKNPETFLNQKAWNDELIFDDQANGSTTKPRRTPDYKQSDFD